MKICIIGDISGSLDEGMKNTTHSLFYQLSKTNEVLQVNPRSLLNPRQWRNIVSFAPAVIHYVPGPSIRSFTLIYFLSILCPMAVTVMSTTRPVLSKRASKIIPFLKPDLLLVQSSKQDFFFNRLGFRTHFFPGGIQTDRFRPVYKREKIGLRKKFHIPSDKFIVLHVGHMTRTRSLEVFEEIARFEDCFVYIVAATSWALPDKTLLSRLKNAGCFINTDFIPEIEQIYQMSDCYIFPGFSGSPSIEIPLSVLEAMACNLPVVTARFGGLPDLFAEGGGLYFANNTDEILASLNHILYHHFEDIRTKEMVDGLSWDFLANKLLILYQDLINKKTRV